MINKSAQSSTPYSPSKGGQKDVYFPLWRGIKGVEKWEDRPNIFQQCLIYTLSIIFLLISSLSLQAQWTELPDNMYADTLAFPFLYGVASGDPTDSQVILWTKLEVTSIVQINPIPLAYRVATDETMNNIVQNGTVEATILQDWTAKVDVQGLEAGTRYYYQFEDPNGSLSQVGRTKTAPADASEELNFVVASCSSVYSGYFNAYRRIAERDEVDLVIHLGDYVYDYPDVDELIRIPEPYPIDPLYLDEWRTKHRYYLLDPDLRLMRQMHPMAAIWDNHDTDGNDAQTTMEAMQAFHEYLPVRQQDEDLHLYRRLQYGDLVDIIMMDAQLYRNQDVLAPGENSILSNEQYDWVIDQIDSSTATWRVFGTQKMFGLWSVLGSPLPLPIGNDTVVDPGSWDGFMLEREMLLSHLKDNGIDNNIFISGDLHFSMAMDIPLNPLDSTDYNPETGEGSIGIEMMGGSITRGNLDENGYDSGLADLMVSLSMSLNPHHKYEELVEHGYGLLKIRPDTTYGQFWHSDILSFVNQENLGKELFCVNGTNHWQEGGLVANEDIIVKNNYTVAGPFPNPANQSFALNIMTEQTDNLNFSLFDLNGKIVDIYPPVQTIGQVHRTITFDLSDIQTGVYFLEISGADFRAVRKVMVVD